MPRHSSTRIPLSRLALAEKRLRNILRSHVVASARTLEQKIADAGPMNQRIDPHIITTVRAVMLHEGEVVSTKKANGTWYSLAETPTSDITARLAELLPIHKALQRQAMGKRIGQALEIAVYRALTRQTALTHFGGFSNLDAHDDSKLYMKEEPPSMINNRSLGPRRLDFLVIAADGIRAGIEVKNVREWMYPDRDEVRHLLLKCLALDCVPVLVARRYAYVTFAVLTTCGLILHQNYNQLFPESDAELARQASDKRLLGFHDIRLGNEPDHRMLRFIGTNLPAILPRARLCFNEYRDLLERFARRSMKWPEFAARVRRRKRGQNEDHDEVDFELREFDPFDEL